MIFVTGATGNVGSEIVRQLKAEGRPFRAGYTTERKAQAAREQGIDAALIDYDRPETLSVALKGIDRLFLVAGGGGNQTAREIGAVKAAKEAGVRHIVKLSVIGAPGESYSFARIHRPVEKEIERSGLTWTFLRPNGFMQNFAVYQGATIRAQSAFYDALGDARISHVDVRDIARVAVKALTENGHEGKAYSLTGPEALTNARIAGIISAVAGREVRYVDLSAEQMREGLVGSGMPEAYADAMLDLLRFYRTEGETAGLSPDIRNLTGMDPIPFEKFAKDHVRDFTG